MPSQINSVTMMGYLGQDPEIREIGKTKLMTFRIANTQGYKKGEDWIDETLWIKIVAWGHLSDFLESADIRKGSGVVVNGTLKEEVWDDKQTGEKRSAVVIKAVSCFKLQPSDKKFQQPKQKHIQSSSDDDVPF